MTSKELRQKFLEFFEKNGHKIVPSSSLLPTDQSVLLTTAGMQQFKPYYLGEKSPYGLNVASIQKCFRTSDIDEVGDESHNTFFEMLGNFSFGGYGKKEAIKLAKDFLDSINIKIDYVTVFGGDPSASSGQVVPRDEESAKAWQDFGFSEKKGNLKFYGREDNFWGPTGNEGPCGPTTEIYVNGVEIWNLVFNEYYCRQTCLPAGRDKKLTKLENFGVDTGMGLERLAMVSQDKSSIFETDLFESFWKLMPAQIEEKTKRIIADHARGISFLISEGLKPSNKEAGYVLRRLIRRLVVYKIENMDSLLKSIIDNYSDFYPELDLSVILSVFMAEQEKFNETVHRGLEKLETFSKIDAPSAFMLYESYGLPYEIIKEIGQKRAESLTREDFDREFEKHKEISRAGAEKKFKGGLAGTGEMETKYHTATHLLLAAMREILVQEIYQKGSNITAERLRFDFNYPARLNEEQIRKIENLVNQKINDDIAVQMLEMPKGEALKIAKISFDPEKYGEIVKVYRIGDFSIELCGGPHVQSTGELGHFKIIKEESSGAGIRRLRAILE